MSSYVRPKLDPLHKSVRLLTLIGIFASYLVGLAPISAFAAPATQGAATISGKVYGDFNNDGQLTLTGTITETGVAGVIITAYDLNNNSSGSATSDSSGNYTITPKVLLLTALNSPICQLATSQPCMVARMAPAPSLLQAQLVQAM